MYRIYKTTNTPCGILLSYLNLSQEKSEITISFNIFSQLKVLNNGSFCKPLLCLVIFRDKFHKKAINNLFDQKVIQFMENLNFETPNLLEDISNMSRQELSLFLQ